jgi:hypothetical protein
LFTGTSQLKIIQSWLWLRFRDAEGVTSAEGDGAAFDTRLSAVFRLKLEIEIQVLRRQDKIGLKADGVYRIKGYQARGKSISQQAGVVRDLPLVIANQPNLKQFGELLVEWDNLADALFHGEGLPRHVVK